MSVTNAKLIEGALRDISVLGETDTASAEQGAIGLERLNQLMASLAAEDIEIGYFAQTTSALTDACPIPAWAERGIRSRLARELLTAYPGGSLSEAMLDDEQNGFSTIRRICVQQRLRPLDYSALGAGSGRYDITTDRVN
jgi:hypothetical protein